MARDYLLASVDKIERYLNDYDNTALLTNMDEQISDFIEGTLVRKDIVQGGYINRKLKATTYTTADYTGNNRKILLLRQYPINSVSLITIDGTTIYPDGSNTLADLGLYIDNEISGGLFYDNIWTADTPNNITITYNAGYSIIPFDIEWAVISMIGRIFRQKGNEGLKSEKLGDYSYTLADIDLENPFPSSQIKMSVDRYMRPTL